jgi:fatty-acyl-CoA synthase
MGYLSNDYIFIVGRAEDMIIINGRNAAAGISDERSNNLPGFKSGDIAPPSR